MQELRFTPQLHTDIIHLTALRDKKVIVHDFDGTLMAQYFREESDLILNPYDARCPNWDIWREALTDADLSSMAKMLMPINEKSDGFWIESARVLFTSVAISMRDDGDKSLEKLLVLLLHAKLNDLQERLKNTTACLHISACHEKVWHSLRSILNTFLKPLLPLIEIERQQKSGFAIRDYLFDDTRQGWLFIPSRTQFHKTARPLISLWLHITSRTLSNLSFEKKRQIWFIGEQLE